MRRAILLLAIALCSIGCGTRMKVNALRESNISAEISLPEEVKAPLPDWKPSVMKDTVTETVKEDGPVIMKAVKDENGEMTATDEIVAAMVSARFRNVAERHGKVDLQFLVTVPASLQDSRWQLRLDPDMYIMGDSVRLEPVIITGAEYRKKQLRGYEQYRRFLESIISDPGRFLNKAQLELFIKRNIPELYKFRNDTSFVTDEEFSSAFGVTGKAAAEHYTRKFLVNSNNRKIARKDKMFSRYVKAPITVEGIRIDTVITNPDGDFIYSYTQTISTCPGLRKAEIVLSGKILENGESIYGIPAGQPLTFYISSLSSLADMTEKYVTKVIPRRVEAYTACYVEFPSGSHEILPDIGNNRDELSRIKENISDLAANREFEMDSIIVTASCSPEGTVRFNEMLSARRAASISSFFENYLKSCRDSAERARGMVMHFGDTEDYQEEKVAEVRFTARTAGENWKMLDVLVEKDPALDQDDKESYRRISKEPDLDKREKKLSMTSFYRHVREDLYPRLRTVRFDFHLHRKGMVLDTVRTTVLDTVYMSGVRAITDRDYKKAVSILRPYGDYNLAVAYCAMDYNASAMEILERLPENDRTLYMLAILQSRMGRDDLAVENYLKSCSMNPSFVHRGNLDPEISVLIKKYGLNRETEF
ncbi:MAG: hypothetical protein ACI3ZC_07005 [Candidatus Cryptobacteroides sp.]